MQNQLEHIARQYAELTTQLSDPGVVANQQQFQALSRKHAHFRPIVERFERLQQEQRELVESQEMLRAETDADMRTMAQEDIARLEASVERLEEELKVLLLPKDPNADRHVVLEIRAGTGGEEAALFAAELFRQYSRFAERRGWPVEILDSNPTGIGGLKEVIALIKGHGAFSMLKYESGVHRVQRVPKTETSGRIHTSAVTVAILPEAEEIDVVLNDFDLRVDVFRASGPGGQGVNTTDSAVRVTHVPSGLVVICRDERSQIKNKAKAMKILRSRLLEQERQAQEQTMRQARRDQVGSGDRSEKIRTYNFPQNRITDHRVGKTMHNLDAFLDGDMQDMVDAVHSYFQAEALKGNAPCN